jgi:hypothetical protein
MLRAADGDKYVNFLITDKYGPSAGRQSGSQGTVREKKNIPIRTTSAGLSKSPSLFPAFCAAAPVPTADGCSFFCSFLILSF